MSDTFITPIIPVLTAKAPYDTAEWLFDFTNTIPAGDTIASITSVSAAPNDLVVGSTIITAGFAGGAALAVGASLSGGTVGNRYIVTAEIVTVAGNQFARSIIVPVAQR